MERYIPASEIDARFDEVMGYADAGETVFLTRDDKPDLVLMSTSSYLDRFGPILSDSERAFLQSRYEAEADECCALFD